MMKFNIGKRSVGTEYKPLVVAEIGINHGGSLVEAKKIAHAAISAGAEVIKHQTHIPDDEMSLEAKLIKPGNSDKSIYDVIEDATLSEKDEFELKNFIESKGVIFISTPFSRKAVERIEKMNLPAIKVGSGECNNLPLINLVIELGKPIILSTGMNSIETVKPTVELIRKANLPYALLHCTNLYPTPQKLIRLQSIIELRDAFPDAILGLSDHSTTIYPCVASVSLGASILERHFTDTRNRIGPDIPCSMNPQELRELIYASEQVWLANGGGKGPIKEEGVTIAFAFASVVADCDIAPGEVLTESNIWVRRPSGGEYCANDLYSLYGKRAKKFIAKNTQIKKVDLI
jgi:N-acetylneuraminate synthase